MSYFNSFFAEYDTNADGVISKREMFEFVQRFLHIPTI